MTSMLLNFARLSNCQVERSHGGIFVLHLNSREKLMVDSVMSIIGPDYEVDALDFCQNSHIYQCGMLPIRRLLVVVYVFLVPF